MRHAALLLVLATHDGLGMLRLHAVAGELLQFRRARSLGPRLHVYRRLAAAAWRSRRSPKRGLAGALHD